MITCMIRVLALWTPLIYLLCYVCSNIWLSVSRASNNPHTHMRACTHIGKHLLYIHDVLYIPQSYLAVNLFDFCKHIATFPQPTQSLQSCFLVNELFSSFAILPPHKFVSLDYIAFKNVWYLLILWLSSCAPSATPLFRFITEILYSVPVMSCSCPKRRFLMAFCFNPFFPHAHLTWRRQKKRTFENN